jgi:hypothetical protein
MMTNELIARIEQTRKLAEDAFWAVVAEKFPEATAGDFDPLASFAMENRMREWITSWVEGNVPGAGEEEYCAQCRRAIDRDTDALETHADGFTLHRHCADELRAEGQLPTETK